MKRIGIGLLLSLFAYFSMAQCPEGFVRLDSIEEESQITLDEVSTGKEIMETETGSVECAYDTTSYINREFAYDSEIEENFGPGAVPEEDISLEDPELYTDTDPEASEYFNIPADTGMYDENTSASNREYEDKSDFRKGYESVGEGTKDAGEGVYKGGKKVGEEVGEGAEKTGKGVYEGSKDVGKTVGKGAGKAGEGVYEGSKEVGKTVGKGAEKAGKGVYKGGKKVGEEVGDVFSSDKDNDTSEYSN